MLNDYYQNIGLKGYMNRYGLRNGLRRGFFNANPFHIVNQYEIKKILWQNKALRYVSRYFKYKNNDPEGLVFPCTNIPDNPVWVFWNTGIDSAPKIVQACYKTIEKYSSGTVIALHERNIEEYVIFPQYIKDKYEKGKISIAGYTDLLRFALLEHYGGTWIDATVYLSALISPNILESDFFALRNTMMLVENPVLYPAWFLHSKAGNPAIREIRNVSFAYWMKEQHVIEYLLPNLIMTGLLHGTETEREIPYMSTDYSEYLMKCLGDRYDSEKLEWIFRLTNIHKLSYKLDEAIATGDSVYCKLIEIGDDL